MAKPFLQRPRKVRKSITWHFLKSLADRPYLSYDAGNEFYWVDFYFPSKKDRKGTFYNATLETSQTKFEDLCKDLALSNASKITEPIFSFLGNGEFSNIKLPLWEGKSWYDWLQQEERRLAKDPNIYVCEELKCFKDYRCGVGLTADINVPIITSEVIIEFIEKFWEQGEPIYRKNSTPLRFPDSSFHLKVNTLKGFNDE